MRRPILRIAKNTALDFIKHRQRLREYQRDLSHKTLERTLEVIEDTQARQDWVIEMKEALSHSRAAMEEWIEKFLSGERHRRVRQAVSMALDGCGNDWHAIAKECGYKTTQSAKNAVTNQLKKTLASPEALALARTINAELQRHGLRQSIPFLGLIDLD